MRSLIELMHIRKALCIVFIGSEWPTDRLALWSFYKLWLALAWCDAQFWLKCQYTLITAYIMT